MLPSRKPFCHSPSAFTHQLVGPAGSGKTQFCTMLAMLTALPKDLGGLGAGAIYIDTEGAFSSERYAAQGAELPSSIAGCTPFEMGDRG